MTVLLPDGAICKTIDGDSKAGDLVDGASLMMYDTGRREVVFTPVKVSKLEGSWDHVNILIQGLRWIDLLGQTMAYINGGPVPVSNYPNMFVTYCPLNPGRFTARYLADIQETGKVSSAIELSWEPRIYACVEGLLVGA